jgi:rhodanese-related sulfurtransferase
VAEAPEAPEEITPERVREMLAEGGQVIDVRSDEEREAGHIAGTRHIELVELAAQAESVDRDRPVVFYCRGDGRSAMATQAFRASGYEAYRLAGGITEWHARGLPLEPADGHVA